MTARPPVAFVVQRYGADVTGGSESLARAVAERLTGVYDLTVFTTCARDYVTWRNELPPGEETVAGVRVRRFPVEEERDLAAFNAFAEPLYVRATTDEEERLFLRRQGPYVPRLVDALGAERDRFAAVVFFTCLYYPTWQGLHAAPERSVLVPTAHDEPPLRFRLYAEAFALAKAFGFLSAAEEALVRSRFPLGDRPALVAGMGVDLPPPPDVERFRRRYGLERPYVLYAGRIDSGKGCAEMLAHFERYHRDVPGAAELVLIGKLAMPEPLAPGVRTLGYLSEEDKAAALAGARVVVCPSPYESLSIVLLEAMALGTPTLVTARSPVLLDHCRRSNAGLWYDDASEFVEGLDLLVREPRLRAGLGENGRAYVARHYRWDAVLERYRVLIDGVSLPLDSPSKARNERTK